MENCVILLLVAIQVCNCAGWTKVWTANTNYDNPNNWDIGRAPSCENDAVVFASASAVSVAVTQSIAFTRMVLPMNGELVLPVNAAVDVINDQRRQRTNCDGREARFVGDVARHWFDPHNWRRQLEGSGRRSMDQLVVPHSERVPCPYDSVEFPPNSTFKVIVEGIEAQINSFTINGKRLDESGLRSVVESETGRRQFDIRSRVSVSGGVCSDPSGCSCGNERPLQHSHICAHLPQPCPPVNDCLDPIKPIGFCCDICGAVIDAKIGYRFHMKTFEDFINSYTEKSKYEDVSAYVYRSYTGGVHAVFADRDGQTADLIKHIKRELQNEAQLRSLDVSSVSFHVASYWTSGPGAWHGGMSGGAVAALIIGLMAATVIAVLFYMQRHRLMPLAFSFGRFVNEDDNYLSGSGFELAQPATETPSSPPPDKPPRKPQPQPTNTQPPPPPPAVGFVNPFYTESDGGMVKEVKLLEMGENPCYVAFERLEDIPEVTKSPNWANDDNNTNS